MVVEELPLREDIDFARRTADIQYAACCVRRDLTSSLILGLSYRLLVRAALFLVIACLELDLQLLSTNFRKSLRYYQYHYETIRVNSKFRSFVSFIFFEAVSIILYILLILLFIIFIFIIIIL